MFIRSQLSTETLGRLILQRVTAMDRPCLKVLYDVTSVTTVLVKQVKTNGLPTFAVGAQVSVQYPNIAVSTTTLNKNKIKMTVPLLLDLQAEGPEAGIVPPTVTVNVNLALEFVMA